MKTVRSAETTFACPFYRGTLVVRQECDEVNSVYVQNLGTCCTKHCKSPWRVCPECRIQKVEQADLLGPRDSTLTAKAESPGGLCKFHRAKGEKARREDFDENDLPEDLRAMFSEKSVKTTSAAATTELAVVDPENVKTGEVIVVNRKRVRPMSGQPREYFDEEALYDLSQSMREVGQVTPVAAVRIYDDPNHDFQLIDGERRWLALEMARIPTIRLLIEDTPDPEEAFERATVANLCREGHTPLEMARAMKRLKEKRGRTVDQLARLIGKTHGHVYNLLRMCELDPEVQKLLEPVPAPKKERGERTWKTPLGAQVALLLTKYPPHEQVEHAKVIVGRRMRYGQASAYLKNLGSDVGGRNRLADDYSRMVAYLATIDGKLKLTLDMRPDLFQLMFARRSAATVADLKTDIKEVVRKLGLLVELIDGAKKK